MSDTPNELRYTATHEWVRVENGVAIVGITQHAQELLGDMVFVELPEVGDDIKAQDELGVVESVKAASDFYAPISGEVIECNEALEDSPGTVNQDPYHDGWLVKLSINDESELSELLSAEQYTNLISEE